MNNCRFLGGLLVFLCGLALAGCDAPVDPDPTTTGQTGIPAAPGSGQPRLSRGPGDDLLLSWLEPASAGMALRYAVLDEQGWQPAHTVAEGGDWFINWADFPSVLPITDDFWAAHWLTKRSGGPYAYDVSMALSLDGGKTWGEALSPHDDGTQTEHGFVSLFPAAGGVGALWLDGRNTVPAGNGGHHAAGGMTLRSAVITPDGRLLDSALVDELVCDCCSTGVAMTEDGPVAVYRDRTEDEIRDIRTTRFSDGHWQPGQRVAADGWQVAGCPVNGPAIVASGPEVGVAWFTAAGDRPRVLYAHSSDSAQSFAAPVEIDTGSVFGRVAVERLPDGAAAVSWTRAGDSGGAELRVRRVSAAGELGPQQVVAAVADTRPAGFPQMQYHAGELVFVWTDTSAGKSSLASRRVALGDLLPTEKP